MAQAIRDANRYGPLTGERLRKLEARLKARLPDDYRAFLLRHNGGRPTLPRFTFVVDGEPQESVLEWFFAAHDGTGRCGWWWSNQVQPSRGRLESPAGSPGGVEAARSGG